MSFITRFFNNSTPLIDAYSFQIKAYESESDLAHDDYIILDKVYIPKNIRNTDNSYFSGQPFENLEYHFYNNFLIIFEQTKENYVQYLSDNNVGKQISYDDTDNNKIYNLKQIKLTQEYVNKLKQYYNLEKQRKTLFEELKDMQKIF